MEFLKSQLSLRSLEAHGRPSGTGRPSPAPTPAAAEGGRSFSEHLAAEAAHERATDRAARPEADREGHERSLDPQRRPDEGQMSRRPERPERPERTERAESAPESREVRRSETPERPDAPPDRAEPEGDPADPTVRHDLELLIGPEAGLRRTLELGQRVDNDSTSDARPEVEGLDSAPSPILASDAANDALPLPPRPEMPQPLSDLRALPEGSVPAPEAGAPAADQSPLAESGDSPRAPQPDPLGSSARPAARPEVTDLGLEDRALPRTPNPVQASAGAGAVTTEAAASTDPGADGVARAPVSDTVTPMAAGASRDAAPPEALPGEVPTGASATQATSVDSGTTEAPEAPEAPGPVRMPQPAAAAATPDAALQPGAATPPASELQPAPRPLRARAERPNSAASSTLTSPSANTTAAQAPLPVAPPPGNPFEAPGSVLPAASELAPDPALPPAQARSDAPQPNASPNPAAPTPEVSADPAFAAASSTLQTGPPAPAPEAAVPAASTPSALAASSAVEPTGPADLAPRAAAPETSAGTGVDQLARIERAESILNQVRVSITTSARSTVVHLNPSSLGSIEVRMRVERGEVHARILADRPETLNLLERHLPEMRAIVARSGVQPEGLELSMSFGEERSGDPQSGTGLGTQDGQREARRGSEQARRDALPNDPSIHEAEIAGDDLRASLARSAAALLDGLDLLA